MSLGTKHSEVTESKSMWCLRYQYNVISWSVMPGVSHMVLQWRERDGPKQTYNIMVEGNRRKRGKAQEHPEENNGMEQQNLLEQVYIPTGRYLGLI